MAEGERCGGGFLETLFPGLADDPFDARLLARLRVRFQVARAVGVPRPPFAPVVPLLRRGDVIAAALRAMIEYVTESNRIVPVLHNYARRWNNKVSDSVLTAGECNCRYRIRKEVVPFHRVFFLDPQVEMPADDRPGVLRLQVSRRSSLTVRIAIEMRDPPPKCPPALLPSDVFAAERQEIFNEVRNMTFWEAEFRVTDATTEVLKEEAKFRPGDLADVADKLEADAEAFFEQREAELVERLRKACLSGE